MTDITSQPDDTRAKRNVAVLVAAQAFLGSQITMIFVMAVLVGQAIAPNPCLATLPISMVVFGSMTTAPWLSQLMQTRGRQTGFFIGTFGGLCGAAIAAFALLIDNFWLFLLGSYLTGIYMSAQGFYRFAAADTASDGYRPKAISYVMAGGLVSALIGPQLVKLTVDMTTIPFFGTYMVAIAINVVGMLLFFALDIPKPPVLSADSPQSRSRLELLRTPVIAVAIICAMVAFSLMNLVMTSTPLAVVGVGLSGDLLPGMNLGAPRDALREVFVGHASDVVSLHVIAMFAPSFFTGHLIARFGAERVVAAGLAILAAAGIVGLSGVELHLYFIALFLLGLGWNFGFIGATALLAAHHAPHERGRVQGLNDLIVFGSVTVASLASGGLLNCTGGNVVQGWYAVNFAMVPFLALAAGAMIWLTLRRRRKPAT